ncbi:MAG TPA: hypothetical protein VNT31_13100 [Nocardioides sp.]|nr:hypothetical protein [Nocardioides sp.]
MTTPEAAHAERIGQARAHLLAAGAEGLAPRPWQHRTQPPDDVDLVRYAAWLAREPDVEAEVVLAGARLLAEARSELDRIESALLFAARAAGSTFPELAEALGLRSAQAAQQRLGRISARTDGSGR